MIEILRQVPLFSDLEEEELQRVATITWWRSYRKGELIFSAGEPATGLFVVESGQVRIYQLSSKGREQVLHLFGPGEVFAEVAVFSGEIYPAFAEALTDCRVLFIPKEDFLELIRRTPDLCLKMLGTLSARLRTFVELIEDLSLREVSARVARYLLETADREGGLSFELDFRKGDLALQLGTTGQTLSRTLRKFRERGIVAVEGRRITIAG